MHFLLSFPIYGMHIYRHINKLHFNSQKWSTCNFSLKNSYIIQQTGNENTGSPALKQITQPDSG